MQEQGIEIAVASSADKVKILINLKEIGLTEELFNATVNGLEVDRKKPFPDIFLNAAAKLNCHPEECLVVEDAVNGIKAAKAAGAKCLALSTSFPRELLSEADWISASLLVAPDEVLNW
jgi:beta-phosphoglucomutase